MRQKRWECRPRYALVRIPARHTFAQMQLKNGLDLYSVSRLMGHVNIMITQRYLLGIKDKDIVDRGTQTSPLMNL